MTHERRRILYSGRVQGVGFRWTTERALAGVDLTGYVRNLPDGRVELVVEGASESLDEAETCVRDALTAYIASAEVTREPPTGEFADFRIRR